MTISTLAIDFTEIRARVAWRLHGKRDVSGLSSEETANIDSVMKSGYRSFLNEHDWSFLKVKLNFPLQSGIDTYEMPEDFGGVVGQLQYRSSDNAYGWVEQVHLSEIQEMRAANTATNSWPTMFSDSPGRVSTVSGQLRELDVWPVPSGDYTLVGTQRINVEALSTTLVYPAGATEHAEAILCSCLAAAEQQMDDAMGVDTQRYQMELAKSLRNDGERHLPDTLGYNGNGPRNPHELRAGRYFKNYSPLGLLD